MLLRTKLTTVGLAAFAVGLGACSSAKMHDTQSGVYVSDGAWIKSVESAPLDQVYQASEAALNELDMAVRKRERGAINGQLTAEEADGKDIKVDLEKMGDNSTRVAIKVGTFGDEQVSRMVLEKIRSNLGATAQGTQPDSRTQPAGFRERQDNMQADDDDAWLNKPDDQQQRQRNNNMDDDDY